MRRRSSPIVWRMNRYPFSLIKSGKRQTLVYAGYASIKRIQIGDVIKIISGSDSLLIEITSRIVYPTIIDMAEREDLSKIGPGKPPDETLSRLEELFPPKKEILGIYVFHIKAVPDGS